jgi:hypothetical protein
MFSNGIYMKFAIPRKQRTKMSPQKGAHECRGIHERLRFQKHVFLAYSVPDSNHRKEPIQQTAACFHFKKFFSEKQEVIQSAATI